MNLYSTPAEIVAALKESGTVRHDGGAVVTDAARFRAEMVDSLVWTAVFAPKEARDVARRVLREAAESLGILPASILPLYEARGRGELSGFTVPAINIRIMAYDTARAVFRAAAAIRAGAFIFEIARSEMGYTDQRPAEYAAVVLAAAIREGWEGPLFIQGDHFQTNAKKMKANAEKEVGAIEALIDGGDPGRLLQDRHRHLDARRPLEGRRSRSSSASTPTSARRFTKFIRAHEPKAMPISVGGEIGEVGKENSTPEEFRAYMDVYTKALGSGKTRRRQDLRADGHVARRRRRAGRLGRAGRHRLQRHRDDLEGRPRGVRPGRRGPARRVDAAARVLRPLSRQRLRRDPPRDRLPEHGLRPSRVPLSAEAGDRALARRERRRRAQARRDARAVPLQDAQEGDRPVQGAASGTCPRARRPAIARHARRRSSRSCSSGCASHDTREHGRASTSSRCRCTPRRSRRARAAPSCATTRRETGRRWQANASPRR